MKKIILVFLILCMCLSLAVLLASCDKGSDKNDTKEESSEEKSENAGEVDGVAVTKDEWVTAFTFDYSEYSCKIKYTDIEEGASMYVEQTVQGNKIKMIEDVGAAIAIDYMENAEGGHYYYNDEGEESDINAERTYTKRFVSFEDTHGDDEFEATKNGPKRMLSPFVDAYDLMEYDAEKGCYFISDLADGIKNVSVYMLDGKISKVIYDTKYYSYEFEITYDNIEVILPEVK